MNKKFVIAIAALMVVALAAPAVMANNVEYSATVVTCNIVVTTNEGGFGNLLAGSDGNEINESLNLTNIGGAPADVNATFITENGLYGLVSGLNVIGGSNFSIGTNDNETKLSNSNIETDLGANNSVPAGETVTYDAKLDVPSGQEPGNYNGTVQLIFTAVS